MMPVKCQLCAAYVRFFLISPTICMIVSILHGNVSWQCTGLLQTNNSLSPLFAVFFWRAVRDDTLPSLISTDPFCSSKLQVETKVQQFLFPYCTLLICAARAECVRVCVFGFVCTCAGFELVLPLDNHSPCVFIRAHHVQMLVCVFDRESKNQLTFQLTSAHIYCCMKDE